MGDRNDDLAELSRDVIVAWLHHNLIDAGEVAREIGLTHRNNVYSYRRIYPDFPQPVITHSRCYMWLRGDIRRWMKGRGKAK